MKLKKINYLGLKHSAVKKRFNADKFLCYLSVKGENFPTAVYYAKNPDKSKGHKNYVLISIPDGQGYVRGMDAEEIETYRYQDAVHCHECDTVIYSCYRHDFHGCACGSVTVDGGKDYTKISFSKHNFSHVLLDLLTGKIAQKRD